MQYMEQWLYSQFS